MGFGFSVDVHFIAAGWPTPSPSVPDLLAHGSVLFPGRPSMSGLHLARRGREQKKLDLHRDFTVASPAEFVVRFGGDRVIEKVQMGSRHSVWGEVGQPASGCREKVLPLCERLRRAGRWGSSAFHPHNSLSDRCVTPCHRGGNWGL